MPSNGSSVYGDPGDVPMMFSNSGHGSAQRTPNALTLNGDPMHPSVRCYLPFPGVPGLQCLVRSQNQGCTVHARGGSKLTKRPTQTAPAHRRLCGFERERERLML
jgi:hypothetical protein